MMSKQRRQSEPAANDVRLVDWLCSEARAQQLSLRNHCLLAVIVASAFAVFVVVLGRERAAVPALVLATLFLVLFVASGRRRVVEGARTLIESLRHRPHEIRRIAHVVYGRLLFRTNAVIVEGDRDGYLFVRTRHWDVVLNGLAARCRNARVELCGSRLPRRR